MKTYTVKAGDLLLGVRQPRKRAIDLMFAASVASYHGTNDLGPGRKDFGWSIDNGGGVNTKLPGGLRLTCKRDDA